MVSAEQKKQQNKDTIYIVGENVFRIVYLTRV